MLKKTALFLLLLLLYISAFSDENRKGPIYTIGIGPGMESYWLRSNSSDLSLPINGLYNDDYKMSFSSRVGIGTYLLGLPFLYEYHMNLFSYSENLAFTMFNGLGMDFTVIQRIKKSLGLSGGIGFSTWNTSSSGKFAGGFGAFLSTRYSLIKRMSLSLDIDYGLPIQTSTINGNAKYKEYYQNINISIKANFQKMP